MNSAIAPEVQGPLVLVVEDDDSVRRSLQVLLRSHGYDVRAFASPHAARAWAQTQPAACLVADLVMPELDGVELLSGLRAKGWQGPAVLVSAFLNDEKQEAASRAGFSATCAKPFREGELLGILRTMTGSESCPADQAPPIAL